MILPLVIDFKNIINKFQDFNSTCYGYIKSLGAELTFLAILDSLFYFLLEFRFFMFPKVQFLYLSLFIYCYHHFITIFNNFNLLKY
ncbi:hypothetical protein C6H68_06620 [Photorhabdus luminescens]|nr:hypothetical protein C6H68_06620 [Photorhabdus luminescens]